MHGAFSANLDRPARVRFAVGKAGKPQGCLPARFPAGASGAQKRRAEKPQGRLYEFKPRILEEDKDMKQFVEMCFDPKSPMNDRLKKAIIEMLEGYAEYYSADLSEKVVRGMTENTLKSKYSGGTLPIVSMLMELQDRENVNLPLYEQQLREADIAIQNLLNAIQQGILTKSTKGRLEVLEAAKEELKIRIACEKLAKPKVSAEFMTFWLRRFHKLDVRQKAHRKMLIDTFINAIFLYDDKIVITFNHKEGTDTITFDDLKAISAAGKTGLDLDRLTAPRRSKLHIACSDFFQSQSALIALLLLSKSNPLRWASIWFWAQSRKEIDFNPMLRPYFYAKTGVLS